MLARCLKQWNSPVTSYPSGEAGVFERQEAEGAGHPDALLFARIEMHLSIRDDGNVSSTLQELHYFLAAPCHCRPTGFRLGILFQSSQIFSIVLKIDLFEFSLCRHTNWKALIFEQDRLPVFDKRLLVDSQKHRARIVGACWRSSWSLRNRVDCGSVTGASIKSAVYNASCFGT
jgi:hypothetical protein